MSLANRGGKHLRTQMAGSFAADVAAHGKRKAIGKNVGIAIGIAIAAYVAYELGNKGIDATMGKCIARENTLREVRFKAVFVTSSGQEQRRPPRLPHGKHRLRRLRKKDLL